VQTVCLFIVLLIIQTVVFEHITVTVMENTYSVVYIFINCLPLLRYPSPCPTLS